MDSGTWSVIGTNFDPDEETANFGTRHALEADGTLFDVFTYATIDPKVRLTIIKGVFINDVIKFY
jgi:hypothetical protein